MSRSYSGRAQLALGLCVGLVACGIGNEGPAVPARTLNFPQVIALGPNADAPTHFYVANSNFDLRYRRGSLQAYSIANIEAALGACTGSCVLDPTDALPDLITDELSIDSYANALVFDDVRQRLYLVTRDASRLQAINVVAGGASFECGGGTSPLRECDPTFDPVDFQRRAARAGLSFPGDPVDLVRVTGLGTPDNVLALAYRGGEVALLVDEAGAGIAPSMALLDIVTELGEGISGVTHRPGSVELFVSSTETSILPTLQVSISEGVLQPNRPLVRGADAALVGFDVGGSNRLADLRQVRFDDDGSRAYVLARTPEALLTADIDPAVPEGLALRAVGELSFGPARLLLRRLRGGLLALVTTFDDPGLTVLAADQVTSLGSARSMTGPFGMAVDPTREWVFVADFAASSVRIVSLVGLLDCLQGLSNVACGPRTIATIGIPRPIAELQ